MLQTFIARERDAYRRLLRKVPALALTAFVLAVIFMNLLANKELVHTPWLVLDCGFALSWIPFLIMDSVCKAYGSGVATRLSILAVAINLITFALLHLIVLTPGYWGEYYNHANSLAINDALNATIGGSTWIVVGSAIAMVAGAATNSSINMGIARLLHRDNYATFAVRSSVSTVIGQFVDNFAFATIVSIPLFGWTWRQTFICAATAALIELTLEMAFSGFGYKLAKSLSDTTS